MFNHAIIRTPCPEIVNGISKSQQEKPDYSKAKQQHRNYIRILKELGLTVTILEADPRFPDSVFVEDVAICTPDCAVITRPGALSRREETAEMRKILSAYYEKIEEIKPPGTLDGGDVMFKDSGYYIGISKRTNRAGAEQLSGILDHYGMTGMVVKVDNVLHLKTGANYLEHNNLLVCDEFKDHPAFKTFNKIVTPPEEAPAANSLWINETVLVPADYPSTRSQIEDAGYKTVEIDISEFEKLNGGLSCLSLRF